MKIITITLNPAFDLHYTMKNFSLYQENYVESILVSAGGKGINISRALSKNGMDNLAYVMVGEDNGPDFIRQLKEDGLRFKEFYCKGRIRENITIHTSAPMETRISLDSFSVSFELLQQLLDELRHEIEDGTIVSLSGRIPKGLAVSDVLAFLLELKQAGCLLAVDSNSFSLEDLLSVKPWLIKPNEQEIQTLFGKQIQTVEEARAAAAKIRDMGIENVIISMGKAGAGAATKHSDHVIKVPSVNPISTIGAGDSTVAGFIGAYAQGHDMEACLKTAVSFGTAACLTEGTDPPRPEDVQRIRQEVWISSVPAAIG